MSAYIEIPSRNPGGGGGGSGGGTWGSIAGTLSNQLDLQDALNNKASTSNPTITETLAASTATFNGYIRFSTDGTAALPIINFFSGGDRNSGIYSNSFGATFNFANQGVPMLSAGGVGNLAIYNDWLVTDLTGRGNRDTILFCNAPTDTVTVGGSDTPGRDRGGWIRCGGRSGSAIGESVQIGTVATVGIGLTADQAVILGSSANAQQHILNTLLATSSNGVGTLANLPAGMSGNPAGFVKMLINGKISAIPFFQ